jgi:hypothetical protein
VSVRCCCCCCCWYCWAVHFQEIQSLYLFCISLRSRGFIFGLSTHTHTHTEWIDYVATYWPWCLVGKDWRLYQRARLNWSYATRGKKDTDMWLANDKLMCLPSL